MNTPHQLLRITLVAGISLPNVAIAASPIEETVIFGSLSNFSALKSDIPIMDTARSLSIESLEEIIDKGALSLDDTYTYSAGVVGETFGFATRGDWVLVRGLSVPQYQDSLQSLFGNYNNARPDIYTLEQVEILKGPASVLFGKGSPGGLVNVISKRPSSSAKHEIQLQYGNFDRRQLAVDSTGEVAGNPNWLYRFVGLHRNTDTQVDFVSDESTVIAPSITWLPNPETDITLLLNYTEIEGDTAAQFLPIVGTRLPAPNGLTIDSSTYLGEPGFNFYDTKTLAITLLASHQINDIWSMEFTSRFTQGRADYQQAWPSFLIEGERFVFTTDDLLYQNGTVPRTFYKSEAESEQAAVDVRFRATVSTGSLEHHILLGAQYQEVENTDDRFIAYALDYNFTQPGPSENLDDAFWVNVFEPSYGNVPTDERFLALGESSNESEDTGLYASDHIVWGDWHLTLGLRFDQSKTVTEAESQKDDAISTSVGLLYDFDNGLSPYASYAESFDPVIGDNGMGQALDAQEGEQIEFGIKYLPTEFPGLITAAWFKLEQSNLFDPSSSPGEFEQQSGIATIEGLELEATALIGDVRAELNLTHLDTESADGAHLASVPKNQASVWATWRPSGALTGFRMGGGARYVGTSWDGGQDELKTPSRTLYDLMLGYGVGAWDIAVNVRNLTNEDYYATCLARGDCFPGDARTIVGQLRYNFD